MTIHDPTIPHIGQSGADTPTDSDIRDHLVRDLRVGRSGLEPPGCEAVGSAPAADANDPLSRLLSRLPLLADPVVLASVVRAGGDVVRPPMVDDRLGDLIRGMAAAAAKVGHGLRAAHDDVNARVTDAADERMAGRDVRVPRPRRSSSGQPNDPTRSSARSQASGVREAE